MKFGDIIPREHGTWAMWIVPALSAALVTHISAPFAVFFIAFALFYLTHRPMIVLMKDRRRTDVQMLLAMIALPAIALAGFLTLAYRLPWLAAFWAVELLLFAFSIKTFVDRDQRNYVNELTILLALTLTAPAAYYSITGNMDATTAELFILNFLFFGSSVFYVKAKIEQVRSKGKPSDEVRKSRIMVAAYHVILVAAIMLLHVFGSISLLMLLGFAPMIVQIAFGLSSKKARISFIGIGVMLVVQSLIFLVSIKFFWN